MDLLRQGGMNRLFNDGGAGWAQSSWGPGRGSPSRLRLCVRRELRLGVAVPGEALGEIKHTLGCEPAQLRRSWVNAPILSDLHLRA